MSISPYITVLGRGGEQRIFQRGADIEHHMGKESSFAIQQMNKRNLFKTLTTYWLNLNKLIIIATIASNFFKLNPFL